MEKLTFGGGCFWCIEAVFQEVQGVNKVISGYAGGSVEDPSYEQVCSGTTGHAEVVQVKFDENKVSESELLDIFFEIHNPETKDREGPDIGSQYRSIILYKNSEQKEIINKKVEELEDHKYNDIVTEISELEDFYVAEDKHQDFYEKNPNYPYCQMHIPEKLSKLEDKFSNLADN